MLFIATYPCYKFYSYSAKRCELHEDFLTLIRYQFNSLSKLV